MTTLLETAIDWVTGALDAEARAATERRIAAEPALRALVADLQAKLAPLDALLPPEQPSAGLLARIEAEIDAEPAPPPGTRTVRADDSDWIVVAPGLSIRLLSIDRRQRRRSLLLRLDPGAELPAHRHEGDEEAFMLEGELHFGDHVLRAGDWHRARGGHPHPTGRSPTGCTVFITRTD